MSYFADTLACALAEAFPDEWPEVAICPAMRLVAVVPVSAVRLLDLSGDGALRIGAVGTLGSGDEPRRLTQRWARAIYEDYPALGGIRYRAAHQGGLAVALWDRGGVVRTAAGLRAPLRLRTELADRVVVSLASQGRVPVNVPASACPRCRGDVR